MNAAMSPGQSIVEWKIDGTLDAALSVCMRSSTGHPKTDSSVIRANSRIDTKNAADVITNGIGSALYALTNSLPAHGSLSFILVSNCSKEKGQV